jgi:hypothetical protein
MSGELPSYASLSGVAPAALHGLLAIGAAEALEATYEFAWQKDRALVEVIDGALAAAADGKRADDHARPRWLDGLVGRELRAASTTYWSQERFARVRLLERLGLVELQADDTYVLAMVSALGAGKVDRLRADPDLVDRAVWRLFEVEGGGEVSLTNVDRFGGDEWRGTFVDLTSDGTLDRGRVLAGCLTALGRDFVAYRASWFSATYLALEPTTDETAGSQAELRRLLGASVPATVAFVLKQLVRIQKAGLLETEATLDVLPPATLVKAKATATAALALARSARATHPSAVGKVARAALGHPHPDVQRTAANLLAELGEDDAVRAAADDLTPGVREELGLHAATTGPADAASEQRVTPLPPPTSSADLAERVAALLEDASDVDELEAAMAGLVARGAEDELRPLAKRARAVVARGPRTMTGDAWLPGQLARLVLDVLGVPVPPAVPEHPAQRFVARRMSEVRTSTAPLLATPDVPGGWVSAAALVERLGRQPDPRHHDLVAALLRLHPDGRDEAGRGAGDLPAAVRFALDGVEPARRLLRSGRQGPDTWWVAADRSRSPYAESEAPRLSSEITTHTWQEKGRERRSFYARFAVTTATAGGPADDKPTELSTNSSRYLGDWIPSLAAVWPHDAEHFLALTCLPVLESPSWTETAHDVPRTLDALARHPGRMGPLAAAILAAGLSATQRDHRLHGVDAFLDLVPAGRIPVHEVASVLARHAQAWPANRWAESLTSAAQAPGGALAVVDLLTHLLPQLPTDHRGVNRLLDVLRDEGIRLDRRVTDPALAQWLGGLSGSSAAARTARLLLG